MQISVPVMPHLLDAMQPLLEVLAGKSDLSPGCWDGLETEGFADRLRKAHLFSNGLSLMPDGRAVTALFSNQTLSVSRLHPRKQ